MRLLTRLMLVGALVTVGACAEDGTAGQSDAGTTGADTTDSGDATDATDGDDATDATDGADATDATDGDDATDGTDGSDATDGQTDGTDGSDATDGTDGDDTTDGTDGSDATDGGSDATDSADMNGACMDPPSFGEITRVTSLQLPTAVAQYDCDANNDGVIDAKDGNLNALLDQAKGFGLDLNQTLAENVADGSIYLGADLNGKATDASNFWINMYIGTDPDPSCEDIQTTEEGGKVVATEWNGTMCPFEVDPQSFADDGCPIVTIPGASEVDGQLDAGPTTFQFSLPLAGLQLQVTIEDGRFAGATSDAVTIDDGRLCGQIPRAILNQALDDACDVDEPPSFCTFKDIVKGLLQCNEGNTLCSIVVHLESGQAASFSVADQ